MSEPDLRDIRDKVQKKLDAGLRQWNRPFRIIVGDAVEEGDWLHLLIQPDRPGVRVSDYVPLLADIEEEFAEAGRKLLLVPTAADEPLSRQN